VKTFSIPELIQTLALNRRTGTLAIMDKHAKAEVHFQTGSITEVALENLKGEEAFYRLLEWRRDSFSFSRRKRFPPQGRSPRIPCNSSWKVCAAWTKSEAAFPRGSLPPRVNLLIPLDHSPTLFG